MARKTKFLFSIPLCLVLLVFMMFSMIGCNADKEEPIKANVNITIINQNELPITDTQISVTNISAAEIALEHHLGLTCDPIGGYVQIPCIERNAVAALRALDAAKLATYLNNSDSKISFDTVVETMLQTGKDLHDNYRETSKGGLAKHYK